MWPQGCAPVWGNLRFYEAFQIPLQPFLCSTAGPPLYSSSSQLAAPPAAAHFVQSKPAGQRSRQGETNINKCIKPFNVLTLRSVICVHQQD